MLAILAALIASQLTVERALSVPHLSYLTAAPSKERFAFVVAHEDGRTIYLADAETAKARAVYSTKGAPISDLAFSPDARSIAFTRGDGSNPASDPRGAKAEIWVVEVDKPDDPRFLLADGKRPQFSADGTSIWYLADGKLKHTALAGAKSTTIQIRGEVTTFALSPDGTRVAFSVARGDHALIGTLEPIKGTITWIAPSIDRDINPTWSPDGTEVAFFRLPGGIGDRSLFESAPVRFELHSGNDLLLAPAEATAPYAQTQLFYGAQNYVVFPWEADGWLRLYAVDADVGAPQPIALSPPECEAESAILSFDRARVYFTANCGDRERRDLYVVPVDGSEPPRALTSGPMIEHSPAPLSDNKHLAFIRAGARQPPLPYLMDPTGRTIPVHLDVSRAIDPAAFIEPEHLTWRSNDNREITAQLFLPPAKGKHPAIIYAHGGPRRQMLRGWHPLEHYHYTYALNQALAARGYVVLAVNFRGGTGYGASFRRAKNFGAEGASELQDLIQAADLVAKRTDVDPAKIGIWGASYGGYLAALALAKRSDRFKSGVAISGFFDWLKKRDLEGRQLLTEDAKRRAIDASPITHAAKWTSPVLLIHGEDDRTVPFSHTVELARRLRAIGKIKVDTLVLPDEAHTPLIHENLLQVARATIDFFDTSFKPAPQSPPR